MFDTNSCPVAQLVEHWAGPVKFAPGQVNL